MSKYIIFTDLDGTLLNHHDYAYKAVLPLLKRLEESGIPVVLNSSKTLSELEIWQHRLHLNAPLVAENGGVILFSEGRLKGQKQRIGKAYDEIRSYIKHLRKRYDWSFEGFGDWTVAEVMNRTSLKSSDAVKAKDREVSEPILWLDTPENLARFEQCLAEQGLVLKKGGRFYHVMAQHDKADAMKYLLEHYYDAEQEGVKSLALGDGENDLSMLLAADKAVVMPPASGEALEVEGAYYAQSEAPVGWIESVERLLSESV
ncbi:MAG: HAD-IIB family hydrolase [Thiomicrorhabdus chilensis]|uniref:HAD-IIB family hydrolase n=1 Tax=Thiomicrorhabdus chilensis TaxID=63656 RepID=UPI00299DD565|nr:HAD-IIB family hydrolase [Thiomicrorhabdus chilensis]MDX1346824.1 HAD-IIB family hydrolase [Thiomicrorhabdus chilensis]